MRRPARALILLGLVAIAFLPAVQPALSAGTFARITPDNPLLSYTEYVHSDITSVRASFTRPGFHNAAVVSSPGVRVSFRTDATAIWMNVNYTQSNPCGTAGCGLFWLEVDGQPRAHGVGTSNLLGARRYRIYTQDAPVAHSFSIIWPYGPAVDFDGLGLVGGSMSLLSPVPTRPATTYVGFGDSITQGYSATGIVRTYPDLVARTKGWSVINAGFGGKASNGADGAPLGQIGGDLITVAIGINDYNLSRSPADTQTQYEQFLDGLRAEQPTVPVYCITPIWGTSEGQPNGVGAVPEDYRNVIRSIVTARMATDPNLYLIEGLDLVPHDASYFTDGLHPTDAGHALYAQNLAALLPA